jgi:hypothetical protein
MEQFSTSISNHHVEADINTIFHLHASTIRHANRSNWVAWGLIVAGVVLTLFILYYFTQSYVRNLVKICISRRDDQADHITQKPQAENPFTTHTNPPSASCDVLSDKTPQVRYSIYSVAICLKLMLVILVSDYTPTNCDGAD